MHSKGRRLAEQCWDISNSILIENGFSAFWNYISSSIIDLSFQFVISCLEARLVSLCNKHLDNKDVSVK